MICVLTALEVGKPKTKFWEGGLLIHARAVFRGADGHILTAYSPRRQREGEIPAIFLL